MSPLKSVSRFPIQMQTSQPDVFQGMPLDNAGKRSAQPHRSFAVRFGILWWWTYNKLRGVSTSFFWLIDCLIDWLDLIGFDLIWFVWLIGWFGVLQILKSVQQNVAIPRWLPIPSEVSHWWNPSWITWGWSSPFWVDQYSCWLYHVVSCDTTTLVKSHL